MLFLFWIFFDDIGQPSSTGVTTAYQASGLFDTKQRTAQLIHVYNSITKKQKNLQELKLLPLVQEDSPFSTIITMPQMALPAKAGFKKTASAR